MAKNDKKPAQIFHFDLYGKREDKYDFLNENSIDSVEWTELQPREPNYFFVQKDYSTLEDYKKGFKVNELFPVNNVGIVTSRDAFVVDDNKTVLKKRIEDFFSLPKEELQQKYTLRENKSWKIEEVQARAKAFDEKFITPISYRPFDDQYVYYNSQFIERSRTEVMQHFLKGENVGLALCKQFKAGDNYVHAFISDKVIESSYVSNKTSEITSTFPLYLYPDVSTSVASNNQKSIAQTEERVPNLNMEIVEQITEKLGLPFTKEKENGASAGSVSVSFSPIDILDYIYAVLHSPIYREKYKEFLKIDFPRIPYPKDKNKFWELVKLGGSLRKIHLLESPVVEKTITQYQIDGNNEITRKISKNSPGFVLDSARTDNPYGVLGKVWINDTQYFDNVPKIAWEFYIGGYQPAQKWLKDRQGRILEFEDILHYQKIIVALTETNRLMKEIDWIRV